MVVDARWYNGGWNVATTTDAATNDVVIAYDAITTHAASDVTSIKHVGANARYGPTTTIIRSTHDAATKSYDDGLTTDDATVTSSIDDDVVARLSLTIDGYARPNATIAHDDATIIAANDDAVITWHVPAATRILIATTTILIKSVHFRIKIRHAYII